MAEHKLHVKDLVQLTGAMVRLHAVRQVHSGPVSISLVSGRRCNVIS